MTEAQKINITALPDAHPRRCLFRVDHHLHTGTLYVSDQEMAREWVPLAAAILELGSVKGVRISHGEVLVTSRDGAPEWRELAREIGAVIRRHVQSGEPAVRPEAEAHLGGSDAIRARAQGVVDDQLNPALAAHGGFVEIKDSDGGDLYITMGGGCQGCSAAAATLRQGIEVAIREAVPEVENIYDATDHAAGVNPYM